MRARVFLVFDKEKVRRLVQHGPPTTKSGECFVAIDLEADGALWSPQRVQSINIRVGPNNTPAPPVAVDLASIPDVCHGRLLPRQTKDSSGKPDVDYACTGCDFSSTWQADKTPHWKFTKVAK